MDKVINPGRINLGNKNANIFCRIKIENGNLTISGVIGPHPSGNSRGGCGQIQDELNEINVFTKGWDRKRVQKLLDVWDEWHLNNLIAGTPRQERAIKEWKKAHQYDYDEACKFLKTKGLYTNKGYEYGSGWLRKELSPEVLAFLEYLPGSKITPAWV